MKVSALIVWVALLGVAAAATGGCGGSALRRVLAPPTPGLHGLPANPQQLLRWDRFPVHYCIDESTAGFISTEQFVALVDRAFSTWGVPHVDDGSCAKPLQDGDGVNEIGWGIPPGQPASHGRVFEAGVTIVHSSECVIDCNPADLIRLTETDIIIDRNAPREFRTVSCVFSTLLHETGHFLGLQHLPPPAVMAAQSSSCPQTLTDADRAALLARYGAALAP
jgi:hypothetical protein